MQGFNVLKPSGLNCAFLGELVSVRVLLSSRRYYEYITTIYHYNVMMSENF